MNATNESHMARNRWFEAAMQKVFVLGCGLMLVLFACNSTHDSVYGLGSRGSGESGGEERELDAEQEALEHSVIARVFVYMPSQSFCKSFEVEVYSDHSLLLRDEFGRVFETSAVVGLDSAWSAFQEQVFLADTYFALGSGPEESITGQVGTVVVHVLGEYGMRCITAPLMDNPQLTSGSVVRDDRFLFQKSIMTFVRSLRLGQSGLAESNHLDSVLF